MNRQTRAKADDHDDRLDVVFRALGDRTRRAILARLARGSATVSELAAPLAMSLPGASKHLKVLERAGLIERSIEGRVHRCSFSAAPLSSVGEWLDTYRHFWDDTLESLARYVEPDDTDREEP
jgi:DNA-binding transcriptional ArsR family regulator